MKLIYRSVSPCLSPVINLSAYACREEIGDNVANGRLRVRRGEMRRAGKHMVAEHSLDRSQQGRAKSLRDIWCQLGLRGQFFQNSIQHLDEFYETRA